MITDNIARDLLYSWHDGQWSAMYAAASSGLVSDEEDLIWEIGTISNIEDKENLLEWYYNLEHKTITLGCEEYTTLPWYF